MHVIADTYTHIYMYTHMYINVMVNKVGVNLIGLADAKFAPGVSVRVLPKRQHFIRGLGKCTSSTQVGTHSNQLPAWPASRQRTVLTGLVFCLHSDASCP